MRILLRIALTVALATWLHAADEETPLERLLALGNGFLEHNSAGEALRAFDSAARVAGGPCMACERGAINALLRLSRYDQAEERARGALETAAEQERPELRLLLGRARLDRPGTDMDPKALAELEALFRELLDAGLDDAGLPLGETLTRLDRDDEARKPLEHYLATGPGGRGARRARELINRPHCGRSSCLPPFKTEALDGEVWTNERIAGQVVLLDFWATWCGPCIDSIPELKKLVAARSAEPFTLISLSIDSDGDALRGVIERYGIDWPQIWDPDGATIRERFGVRNFPTYVLVDHTGVVRGQYNGWAPGFGERLAGKIDRMLQDVPRPDR